MKKCKKKECNWEYNWKNNKFNCILGYYNNCIHNPNLTDFSKIKKIIDGIDEILDQAKPDKLECPKDCEEYKDRVETDERWDYGLSCGKCNRNPTHKDNYIDKKERRR